MSTTSSRRAPQPAIGKRQRLLRLHRAFLRPQIPLCGRKVQHGAVTHNFPGFLIPGKDSRGLNGLLRGSFFRVKGLPPFDLEELR